MPAKIAGGQPDRNPFGPGKLLTLRQAAAYLSVSRRWLEDNPDVPFVNLALPGRKRAMRRYRVGDLDSYVVAQRGSSDGRR